MTRPTRDHVVVLDVPLLVESGRDDMAALVVVDADPEVAVERLVEQRGFDEADARARIARQASREERLARADFVIHNDGDRDDLAPQIDACWAWIVGPSPAGRRALRPDGRASEQLTAGGPGRCAGAGRDRPAGGSRATRSSRGYMAASSSGRTRLSLAR